MKPSSLALLAHLLSDGPPTRSATTTDIFVYDFGRITRSTAPRTSPERREIQYHDCRSHAERAADQRSAKEIALNGY